MAIVRIGKGTGAGASDPTSTGFDSTGATLGIGVVSIFSGSSGSFTSFTDSKSNTWNALTLRTTGAAWIRLYWSLLTSVGASHTVTANGSSIFGSVWFGAYSGSDLSSPFDVQNGNLSGGTSISTNSVTPSMNGSLLIAACSLTGAAAALGVTNSFTMLDQVSFTGGSHEGYGVAELIQTTAASVDTTFSTVPTNQAAVIASFKPGSGPPPPSTSGSTLLMTGIG